MSEPAPLTPTEVMEQLAVSRETVDRFQAYLDLLRLWRERINLVGRSTLGDPWRRHILDSGQVFHLLPEGARTLIDLGSGAGLPGLILAIMGVPDVHLIESDGRKVKFLEEAVRVLGLAVKVHYGRIEAIEPIPADVVTARALASLEELLDLAQRFSRSGTQLVFLKGRNVESELTRALRAWKMRYRLIASSSSSEGRIVLVDECRRIRQG